MTTRVVCLFALLAAVAAANAQVVTNTFTSATLDFVTNGIIGSGFDGADLAFGDVPNANNGGAGNGATLAANSGVTIGSPGSGFLLVQTINSAWGQGGPGDDGFFAFNIVKGDFTLSVDVAEPYDNQAYTFSGLMARAISDGTGAAFNPSGTNASENWVSITLFEEFGIPTMSEDMTNGNSTQISNNGTNSLYGSTTSTNADVFLEIKRVGDNFLLSDSVDGVTWKLEQTIARPDLHDAAMQVGIEEATYTPNTPIIFFADYGVVGTNIIKPPTSDPANIIVTNSNPSGFVDLSWTPAAGSDGSVVVVRANAPIAQSPYYSFAYVGNPTNGAAANMGAEQQVLYSGSGTNFTVSGLLGNNNVYNIAVYSYTTNTGTTPITYDSAPAVTSFNGPGTLQSVSFVTSPPAIPVGGVGLAVVTACFSTGDCYDVSSATNIALNVDNPTVLTISDGVMNGLTNGTANVTATYAGISGTNVVTVHSPAFTDNFAVTHDYVTNGLLGTSWDGEYLNFGDVPGGASETQTQGGDVAGTTTVLDADTNTLSLVSAGSSWEGAGDDGPFLFKIVTGDFQAVVNVQAMSTINLNAAGLMARLFDNSGSPTQGAAGGSGGETHVSWWKVQAGALSARYTLDGALPTDVAGVNTADTWLLLQRYNSTNFLCYEKASAAASWTLAATFVVPEAADNAAMEVGIAEQMLTASAGTAQFDSFLLDGVGIASPTGVEPPPPATNLTVTLNDDLSMTVDWTAESNGVPIQSMVVVRANAPVSAQPPYGYLFDSGPQPFGAGSYMGDGNWVVYRSPNPPAAITNSTIVTGLTPGTTYYVAVYTWTGASTTKVFDNVIPTTGASAQLLDGVLTNVVVETPPSIPAGGIGQLQVLGYYEGGAVVNVSQFATLMSTDTNVVETADGVITGYTNGTAKVVVMYSGFSNSVNVTVRSPSYTDNFTVAHDYLSNGVAGTLFDGVYTNYGDIPEQSTDGNGNNASDATLALDAGITTPGMLTITNYGGGWEFATDDGTFLFKYVPGDFQMAVHLNNYSDTINYTIPSIMARAYSDSTNGGAPNTGAIIGAPLDGEGGECYVRMARFDEYGIGTYPEITIDDSSDQTTQLDPFDGDNWLLLVRRNGTNFNVYQRSTNTEPWHLTPNKTSFSNSKFAGVPMQVGLTLSTFNGGVASYAQFDTFMLDSAVMGPTLQATSSGGNITVTWNDTAGAVLQTTPSLNPENWQAVGTATNIVSGADSVTLPIGAGSLFFRLAVTSP